MSSDHLDMVVRNPELPLQDVIVSVDGGPSLVDDTAEASRYGRQEAERRDGGSVDNTRYAHSEGLDQHHYSPRTHAQQVY